MCSLLVHFWEDPNDEDVWRQSRQTPAALRLQTSRSSKVQNPVGVRMYPRRTNLPSLQTYGTQTHPRPKGGQGSESCRS